MVEGIWLGRAPLKSDLQHSGARQLLNVSAEILSWKPEIMSWKPEILSWEPLHALEPCPITVQRVPMLDLIAPKLSELKEAVILLDQMAEVGKPVMIHCALGLSRSVLVIAGWLLYSGQASGVENAISQVKEVRPDCVINDQQKQQLSCLWQCFEYSADASNYSKSCIETSTPMDTSDRSDTSDASFNKGAVVDG